MMTQIRNYRPTDKAGTYYVCLKTGDNGADGEPFYQEDPDALARIYVGPYLEYAPSLALVLEDDRGICGYALGAIDSRQFYDRYEREWRPNLCQQFPEPTGDSSSWSRIEAVHWLYHHPDYTCPEPYEEYPSHLHIDLLPRTQGQGFGRRMMEEMLERLRRQGTPGVHLGMSAVNDRAYGFYKSLGFEELMRDGSGEDDSIYMGLKFA
jgi:ribosomal protein S18 acetylase RimI-like enzyme